MSYRLSTVSKLFLDFWIFFIFTRSLSQLPPAGFEINARPLARGDWKRWGMSRIFAQVVRRASGYFNLFFQLRVTMNETNYPGTEI